jgi:hypothetical protein
LAQNDECSFYDKKRQLNLHNREGKSKFLKHICALSNSNPTNNSYIIVGVEDLDNEIIGDDFFDDSRIQNLVNAFLTNAPIIQYDNIPFPDLPKDKVVGLVTIKPNKNICAFTKNIHMIVAGQVYVRRGSNSIPVESLLNKLSTNKKTVHDLEKSSKNSIEYTLDGVLDFMTIRHPDMQPKHKVFKELFVVCWAGNAKKIRNETYYSRVSIELINEQVKLFYSSQDHVSISFDAHSFTIIEYVHLGLNDKTTFYPLEEVTIRFFENGYYKIDQKLLFEPPIYNRKLLFHIYNSNVTLLEKLKNNIILTDREVHDLQNLPSTFMICYFNGFGLAKQNLIDSKYFLKPFKSIYKSFKESLRILRKVKYNK